MCVGGGKVVGVGVGPPSIMLARRLSKRGCNEILRTAFITFSGLVNKLIFFTPRACNVAH